MTDRVHSREHLDHDAVPSGVLKAIGARDRTLMAGVMAQAVGLTVIGLALAVPIGLVLDATLPPDSIPFVLGPRRLSLGVPRVDDGHGDHPRALEGVVPDPALAHVPGLHGGPELRGRPEPAARADLPPERRLMGARSRTSMAPVVVT